MLEPTTVIAATALIGLMVTVAAVLRGWQGWLALKERELASHLEKHEQSGGSSMGAARIELSDLKERIKKLEAIASGVDL